MTSWWYHADLWQWLVTYFVRKYTNNRQIWAYEECLETYFSCKITTKHEECVSISHWIGESPPPGNALRGHSMYERAKRSYLTTSNHKQHPCVRNPKLEYQDVFSIDWTCQVVKNYLLVPSATAYLFHRHGGNIWALYPGIGTLPANACGRDCHMSRSGEIMLHDDSSNAIMVLLPDDIMWCFYLLSIIKVIIATIQIIIKQGMKDSSFVDGAVIILRIIIGHHGLGVSLSIP